MTRTKTLEAMFQQLIEQTLEKIENILDNATSDIDYFCTSRMLTITFIDKSQIIISSQPGLLQLWLACRDGGFKFDHNGKNWHLDSDASYGLNKILSKAIWSHASEILDFSSLLDGK